MEVFGVGGMQLPRFSPFNYYEYPEGQFLGHKLISTGIHSAMIGGTVAVFDVACYSHPKGVAATLFRTGYVAGSFMGMAASFTAGTYLACRWRDKDDIYNYFVGGVAAGHFLGAVKKCCLTGFVASVLFGLMGMVKKNAVDNDYDLLFRKPDIGRQLGTVRAMRHDFTILKAPEKNWVTDPKDA